MKNPLFSRHCLSSKTPLKMQSSSNWVTLTLGGKLGGTIGGTMGGAGPERREQSFQLDYDAVRDDKKSGVCQDGWVQVPKQSPSPPPSSTKPPLRSNFCLACRSVRGACSWSGILSLGMRRRMSAGDNHQMIIIIINCHDKVMIIMFIVIIMRFHVPIINTIITKIKSRFQGSTTGAATSRV